MVVVTPDQWLRTKGLYWSRSSCLDHNMSWRRLFHKGTITRLYSAGLSRQSRLSWQSWHQDGWDCLDSPTMLCTLCWDRWDCLDSPTMLCTLRWDWWDCLDASCILCQDWWDCLDASCILRQDWWDCLDASCMLCQDSRVCLDSHVTSCWLVTWLPLCPLAWPAAWLPINK